MQQLADIPVYAELLEGLRTGKIAAAVARFEPERTAETVKALIIQQQVKPEPRAQLIEENIAGNRNRTGDRNILMETGAVECVVDIREIRPAVEGRIRTDLAGIETGSRGDRLEGRARTVETVGRAVDQRIIVALGDLAVIVEQLRQIVGRERRRTEHRIVLRIEHDNRTAVCIAAFIVGCAQVRAVLIEQIL